MGRPTKFDTARILDTARELLLTKGPKGVTAQGVAAAMSAPSGSIYHRFANRDAIAAEVWLRAVERFQADLVPKADHPDPVEAAVRCARHVLTWCRSNLEDARVLILYRPSDLAVHPWPEPLHSRDRAQRAAVETLLKDLRTRLTSTRDITARAVQFAVVDVPHAAVRPALLRGTPPETALDALVELTARTVLTDNPPTEESR